MSDPKRLLETRELGELGKSALGAAVELDPPAGARERVWSELGAKLPFAGDPVPDLASGAGGAGLGGAAGGAAATGGASALGVTLAKVAGGLVALGAVATGGVAATGAFDPAPASVAPAVSAPAGNPKAAEPAPTALPALAPAPLTQSGPEAAPAPVARAPKAASAARLGTSDREAPRATAPSTASFPTAADEAAATPEAAQPDPGAAAREESRLVGAARDALRGGDGRSALTLLNEAHRRFPAGVLGQERTALAIEASLRTGARAEANELARVFLKKYPSSPHAARVRALIAAAP